MGPVVKAFQLDRAIGQRNHLHGWMWPRGAESSVAKALGVSQQRIAERRLELLLHRIRRFP